MNLGRQPTRLETILITKLVKEEMSRQRVSENERVVIHHIIDDKDKLQVEVEIQDKIHNLIYFRRMFL